MKKLQVWNGLEWRDMTPEDGVTKNEFQTHHSALQKAKRVMIKRAIRMRVRVVRA